MHKYAFDIWMHEFICMDLYTWNIHTLSDFFQNCFENTTSCFVLLQGGGPEAKVEGFYADSRGHPAQHIHSKFMRESGRQANPRTQCMSPSFNSNQPEHRQDLVSSMSHGMNGHGASFPHHFVRKVGVQDLQAGSTHWLGSTRRHTLGYGWLQIIELSLSAIMCYKYDQTWLYASNITILSFTTYVSIKNKWDFIHHLTSPISS